jgi:hypothetical protein
MDDERHNQQLRALRMVRNVLLLVLAIVSVMAAATWVAGRREVAELQGTVDDLRRLPELEKQVARNEERERAVAQAIAKVEPETREIGSGPDDRVRLQELSSKMKRLRIELEDIRRSNQEMAKRLARLKRVTAVEGR